MTHPDDEVLAALCLGEDIDASHRDHATECPRCRQEVQALRDVLALARAGEAEMQSPDESVWRAIEAGLVADRAVTAPPKSVAGRRRVWQWALAAAVAGVLVGVVGGRAWERAPLTWDRQTVDLKRASLSTLDTSVTKGEADLRRTGDALSLQVNVDSLRVTSGYLEVWLINRDLTRMVSVGVLPSGSTSQSYPVAQRLIDEGYVIVDISQEEFDDRPQHSGDSLVRGALN